MRLHLTALLVVGLLAVPVAGANHGAFKNYFHAQYVCNNGANWHQKVACKAMPRLVPRGETQIRAYIAKKYPGEQGRCMAAIVGPETAHTWSPTIYNYAGSGAYGLPQALPGGKMASAGTDWEWNPITQLKWMWNYMIKRYGSACDAYHYRESRGTY